VSADAQVSKRRKSRRSRKSKSKRIKVIYIGERLCAADDGDALIRALANRHGCSVEQARAIAADLKNT
jgi:hypothetical protein